MGTAKVGNRAEYVDVYQILKDSGAELDSHESDLYVKATPEAVKIVKDSGWTYTTFTSQVDGLRWLDVAFAFRPFWDKKQENR